jgi:hypothetical protein
LPEGAPEPFEELAPAWVAVDPGGSVVDPVAGAFAAGAATEITCGGVAVGVLSAPARPISTPTPIASSSTPTPAIVLAPDGRFDADRCAGASDAIEEGVKLSRNRLRASSWRAPHSRQ